MTSTGGLGGEARRTVWDVLSRTAPLASRVWMFGSRARGTARPFSDLDLAIDAGRRLSIQELAVIACGFEESDLPWRVDVVDLQAVSKDFRAIIERDGVSIAMPTDDTAAHRAP